LAIVGYVQDRLGAQTSATTSVSVSVQPGVAVEALAEQASGKLAGLIDQADGEAVVRTVAMLGQMLNAGSTTSSSSNSSGGGGGSGSGGGSGTSSGNTTALRATFMQHAETAQLLMAGDPRSVQQQAAAVSEIAARPSDLDTDTQQRAVGLVCSLVGASAGVGILDATAAAVAGTLSSVLEAGLLDAPSPPLTTANRSKSRGLVGRSGGSSNSNTNTNSSTASKQVVDVLQQLSVVMLSPSVAGEEPATVQAKHGTMSASRKPMSDFDSGSDSSSSGSPSPSTNGSAVAAVFQLPVGFGSLLGTDCGIATENFTGIDSTLVEWKNGRNPFAYSGEAIDSGVASFTLRAAGAREPLKVRNLTKPIVLLLPISDPAPWRELATSGCHHHRQQRHHLLHHHHHQQQQPCS
jgi:hypothetical protein